MEALTNTIEAILFASGKAVALSDMADKLGASNGEIRKALEELKKHYGESGGIQLLEFNKKVQLGSNPVYKSQVESVLNPIREKELTRTILECAAIIAYKQPITRTESELLRGGVNSDYAVNALLELKLIEPCGRKDAVGRPVLFATTDEFLKRFRLSSLEDLPDYEELMKAIRPDEDKDSYLYAREEYGEIGDGETAKPAAADTTDSDDDDARKKPSENKKNKSNSQEETVEGGYEIPDFLRGLDETDIVKIS